MHACMHGSVSSAHLISQSADIPDHMFPLCLHRMQQRLRLGEPALQRGHLRGGGSIALLRKKNKKEETALQKRKPHR
jgi:hypothetical protein